MDLYNYQPAKKFSQGHMLRIQDYTADELLQVLSLALKLKEENKKGIPHHHLAGKTLAMIFTKNSTRTRVSFEVGMYQLGGTALFLSAADIQLKRGETISDTAKTLSRMVDGIMIRTFAQADPEDLAKYGSVPVINGLTDESHPCQALADLLTFYEYKGGFAGKKLAYIGDGNNVANSLLAICAKLGVNISVACPKGYTPGPAIMAGAFEDAKESGANVFLTHDPYKAVEDADAVYTDVWASMGQEAGADEKYKDFEGYEVNADLMKHAKSNAIFLHCLPAHRGEEVSGDVIDGPQSAVFDQAENRLHAQKALMVLLMKGE
jgi:ornithine carbamoyltransferase